MRGISHFCESSQHFSRKRFFCEVDFFANGDQAGRLFLRKRCDIFANENGCVTAVRNHSFWYPQNSIQLTIVSKSFSIPTKTTICTVSRDRLRRRNQTKGNLPFAFQLVCGPRSTGPQTNGKASGSWGPQKTIKTNICAVCKVSPTL